MKLTEHFTLEELTRSTSYPNIANSPTPYIQANLTQLCKNVLEPTRVMMGEPLIITSGYRCRTLNAKVGGATNSYHLKGWAADIHVRSDQMAQTMLDIFALNVNVDVALYEHSKTAKWVHVQTSDKPRRIINRNYSV